MNHRARHRVSAALRTVGGVFVALLVGCAAPSTPVSGPTSTTEGTTTTPTSAARPSPLWALDYVAGSGWKAGKPPQEQDLGGHFAYVDKLFAEGKLVVNGLYGDEVRGLYVFGVATEADVRAIVANDPAVQNGTLAADRITSWQVLWDGLAADLPPSTKYFVLEYGPGKSWLPGRSAMEQKLDGHFAYVTAKQKDGKLIAAGPIGGTDHGRYVVVASSKADADAFVAEDPGVRAGVVAPVSERPWSPVHRQTQAAAAQARKGAR